MEGHGERVRGEKEHLHVDGQFGSWIIDLTKEITSLSENDVCRDERERVWGCQIKVFYSLALSTIMKASEKAKKAK